MPSSRNILNLLIWSRPPEEVKSTPGTTTAE
jgi:hypothetical protein